MLTFLGIVTLYFVIGFGLAKRDLPYAWDRARDQWSSVSSQVGFVKAAMLLMFFFWPIKIPVHLVNNFLGNAAVGADPKERERQLKERQRELEMQEHDAKVREIEQKRYIKSLEDELGIGRDQ